MVLANLGVRGLPSGPLSDCPCCWAAGEQAPAEGDAEQQQPEEGQGSKRPLPGINIDFCFSLCHLARCGTAELQLPPPNQRLFLNHQPGVGDLLKTGANSSAAAQADPDAACSDFDAAKVLGRTDEKVGLCNGVGMRRVNPAGAVMWLAVQVRFTRCLAWMGARA